MSVGAINAAIPTRNSSQMARRMRHVCCLARARAVALASSGRERRRSRSWGPRCRFRDRKVCDGVTRASANLTAAVTASDVTASLRVTVSCDDVTLETGLSAAQPLRVTLALRRNRCVVTGA